MVSYISNEPHNELTIERNKWSKKGDRTLAKKTTVGQMLGYLFLSILPAVLMTVCILCSSYIKQMQLGGEYIGKYGTPITEEDFAAYAGYILERYSGDTLMTVTIIGQVAAFLIGLFLLFRVMKAKAFGNPVKAFSGLRLPGTLLGAIGAELTLSCVLVTIGTVFPGSLDGYAEMIQSSGLAGLTLMSTIATLVTAPLCEEIIFRGLTTKILEKTGWSFWVVNTIQAVIFGVAHLNLVQGAYAFLLGMFLGFVAKKCNSLWGSILAHAAFNFSGTYLVSLVLGTEDCVPMVKVIIVAVAAIIVFTIGIMMLNGKKKGEVVNE